MAGIEQLLQMMPRSINAESAVEIKSTNRRAQTLRGADFAAMLIGLTPAQEQLIWCKYLGEKTQCQKGLESYRQYLYQETDIRNWIKCPDRKNGLEKCQDERSFASVILSRCAFNDMIGSVVCTYCRGTGDESEGCKKCYGTGYRGQRTDYGERANLLHVSRSTYVRSYHQQFQSVYWNAVVRIETQGIMKIYENFSGDD